VEVQCWSPDIFPTLLALTKVSPDKLNALDGTDITEIIKGNQVTHQPVFSMHNNRLMSVRKGDWKLFVHNPGYFKMVDLTTWRDSRGPDGKTIIAPLTGQATPALYPGIIPVKTENEIQLYNLKDDSSESKDLSGVHPEKVNELLQEVIKFEASMAGKN
jgi:arylsulfatase A-like enzyme